ncbi:MAG: SDR family NAD(P)-dependent oxidoreductase [Chthoniobacterales bacterium]
MGLFSGQTILVTGASGGVGEAMARSLSDRGATVCLTGRNEKRLEEIARQLPEGRTRWCAADLTAEGDLQKLADFVLEGKQCLAAIVHCAAIIVLGEIATATRADFEKQFQTNVIAPFRLTQLLLPALISSRGQVVFINSGAGRHVSPANGQYAATKHALRAVADSLRNECNAAGMRVCSLFLGSTATPMQAAIRAEQERPYEPERLIQPGDVADMVGAILALPRTAEVTDLDMRPAEKA